MLERIFAKPSKQVTSNFGILLSVNQDHQEYFKLIREEQNKWATLNPKIVNMIKKIRETSKFKHQSN